MLANGTLERQGRGDIVAPVKKALVFTMEGNADGEGALGLAPAALAQTSAPPAAAVAAPHQGGGEASLKLPDLSQATFVGMSGRTMLQWGLLVCLLGLGFGLVIYSQLKNLPVHQSM